MFYLANDWKIFIRHLVRWSWYFVDQFWYLNWIICNNYVTILAANKSMYVTRGLETEVIGLSHWLVIVAFMWLCCLYEINVSHVHLIIYILIKKVFYLSKYQSANNCGILCKMQSSIVWCRLRNSLIRGYKLNVYFIFLMHSLKIVVIFRTLATFMNWVIGNAYTS